MHPIMASARGLLFAATTLVVIVSGPAFGGSPEVVTMVQDSEYSPYMTATADGASGIYAEILREADRRLPDYEIELTAVPWERAMHLVRSGQINALVGTYQRPRERPWLRLYSTAIMYESIYVYCHKGVARRHWSYPEDFAGLVFGNNKGFETPGPDFFDMVEEGRVLLSEEQTTELNLRLIQFGRIDCFVQDEAAVGPLLTGKTYDNVEPVRQLTYEAVYVGYSDKWSSEAADRFTRELDRVLLEMKQDGTANEIIFRNFRN
ncbi:substrate-binding periplasmic protein [Roseibium sp. M-1]